MAQFARLDECPWLAETPEERRYVEKLITRKADLLMHEQEEQEWQQLADAAKAFDQIPETVRPPAFQKDTTHVRKKKLERNCAV